MSTQGLIDDLARPGARPSIRELETLYAAPVPVRIPQGRFVGRVLTRLDNPGASHPFNRWSQWFGFEALRFGIDFDRRAWWFVHPSIQLGRFRADITRSRWRDTETLALHYDTSALPGPVRGFLYDEVKPLREDLVLGLGGINRDRFGDHFFFKLRRMAEPAARGPYSS